MKKWLYRLMSFDQGRETCPSTTIIVGVSSPSGNLFAPPYGDVLAGRAPPRRVLDKAGSEGGYAEFMLQRARALAVLERQANCTAKGGK